MRIAGEYFYGNKISEYGLQYNKVDYATLAKSFDAVLNNEIMQKTAEIGWWKDYSGSEMYFELNGNRYTYDEKEELVDELQEKLEELEQAEPTCEDDENEMLYQSYCEEYKEWETECEKLQNDIDQLNDIYYDEVFQYYIVSDNGAEILKEANEIVWYNEELDMYVWGVTHYGTSWDYVLTNIPCNCGYDSEE